MVAILMGMMMAVYQIYYVCPQGSLVERVKSMSKLIMTQQYDIRAPNLLCVSGWN